MAVPLGAPGKLTVRENTVRSISLSSSILNTTKGPRVQVSFILILCVRIDRRMLKSSVQYSVPVF